MTVSQALALSKSAETELLLGHTMRKPKEFLYMNPEKTLTVSQEKKFKSLMSRRSKGEPIAYVVGYKYFYGLKFKVTKHTLIPRPETEWIVEHLAKLVGSNDLAMSNLLDLGTGSGCIAITLKKYFPEIKVTASDVSAKALQVAKQNAASHHAKIDFIRSDLLTNFTQINFDIIIANLPYLDSAWKNNSQESRGLTFEPAQALFTKEKGLYLYRKLLVQISQSSKQPRKIYLEIDPRQKVTAIELVKKVFPEALVTVHKDLGKRWRYIEADL